MKTEKPKRFLAYTAVYNNIRDSIERQEYIIGSLLPPEPQLELQYSVSRTTIRKAIDMLVREGYVRVKQGYGTEVIYNKTAQNLNVITSVSQTLANKGYLVGVKNMYITIVSSDIPFLKPLELPPNSKVAEISRIQTADGIPVSIVKNYISYDLVKGIDTTSVNIVSLYKFLSNTYGVDITASSDIISAKNATFEDAILLETNPGTALITIDRICYSDGKAVEIDFVKILGSKYQFEVNTNL